MKTSRQLTKRQAAFVKNMASPDVKSQTEAYLNAYPGASASTAMANSSKLLRNAKISRAINDLVGAAATSAGATLEEFIGSALAQMRTSIDDVIDKDGRFDLDKARATGAINFVRRLTVKTTSVEVGGTVTQTTTVENFELLSSQSARSEIVRYADLGIFRLKDASWDAAVGEGILNLLQGCYTELNIPDSLVDLLAELSPNVGRADVRVILGSLIRLSSNK